MFLVFAFYNNIFVPIKNLIKKYFLHPWKTHNIFMY